MMWVWEEDIELPNRGWQVDRLSSKVGYLNVSYVPKGNVDIFIPNVATFCRYVRGFVGLDVEGNLKEELALWRVPVWEAERDYREHLDYFVDKPLVDYVYVEEEYRGQGYAKQMYHIVAGIMQGEGMKLYAGLRNDMARAVWGSFAAVGQEKYSWKGEVKTRDYVVSVY